MPALRGLRLLVSLAVVALPAVSLPLGAQIPVVALGDTGQAVAALQVALTNRDFSSGAIDGRSGRLLQRALVDYQRSRGLATDGIAGPAVWADLGLDPASAAGAFRTYRVTADDTVGLAELPEGWRARAGLAELPYVTTLERLGERFQTDPTYLASLTPEAGWPAPPPGTDVRVPAVDFQTVVKVALPYRRPPPAAVAAGQRACAETPGADSSVANVREADSLGGDSLGADSLGRRCPAPGGPDSAALRARDSIGVLQADSAIAALRREWERRAPPDVEVRVSVRRRAVRVYEGGRLVASYPATVGSSQFPNPRGAWRVASQVYAPDYRYDERYLRTGQRSPHALRIPPGPNNIVGLVWLGLDKPGYGLHGTDEPETIGQAASHGCVRLTNWDAERLARRVGIGTRVLIGS